MSDKTIKLTTDKKYKTLEEFYPFYLSQHANNFNRLLHYIGTILAMINLIIGLYTLNIKMLSLAPICGYAFAWFGHFFYEKNKPATFKYPLYSLICDYLMVYDFLTGRICDKLDNFKIKNIKYIPFNYI